MLVETPADNGQQPQQAADQQQRSILPVMALLAVLAVIVIIVGYVYFSYSGHSANSPNSYSNNSAPSINEGYLSLTQAGLLLGSYGTYNTNSSVVASTYGTIDTYHLRYVTSSTALGQIFNVYQNSTVASEAYAAGLTTTPFNLTYISYLNADNVTYGRNVTSSGIIYSYTSYYFAINNTRFIQTNFLAQKDKNLSTVIVAQPASATRINVNSIVSSVAADMK